MIMRKRWVKASIAMLALTAMLTETAYSAYASVSTEYASTQSESSVPESESTPAPETPAAETPAETPAAEVSTPAEQTPAPGTVETPEIIIENPEDTGSGVVSASLNAYEDRIEASGMSDLTLYINTDQMNDADRYRLALEGSGSASLQYDAVLASEMSKSNSGIYYIAGLNQEPFRVYAAGISEGMSVQYSVRSDGNPQITLVSAPKEEVQKKLEVSADGSQIIGEGYEDLTLSFESAELPDENYFALFVNTSAAVSYNGSKLVNGSIPSLSNATSSVRLSDLDKQSFSLYIAGENVDTVQAVYSIDSVDNGTARIVVSLGEGAQAVQSLNASSEGITGSGYDKIELSMEYIEKIIEKAKAEVEEADEAETEDAENPEDVQEETVFGYSLYVETKAENAAVNGQKLEGGKADYTNAMESVVIDGLEKEPFRVYAVADEAEDAAEPAAISYSVKSVENGTAKIAFTYTTEVEETANKRVYEYEDEYVSIKVTLQNPEDLPDEAELHADAITPENNPEYYAELGKMISDRSEEEVLSLINYIAYDVYFTVDGEETEPANPVEVNMVYKQKTESQISETPVEEVKMFHFNEDEKGNVTSVEDVTGSVRTDANGGVKEVGFQTDSFSPIVAAEFASVETFEDNGGAYTFWYILNNFNYFVREGANTNHTVGPVVVGGAATIGTLGNGNANSQRVSSYIKGLAKTGNFAGASNLTLYLGTVNKNNSETNVAGIKEIKYTDDYIDFDKAFSALNSQANSVSGDVKITDSNISNMTSSNPSLYTVTNTYWKGMQVDLEPGYSYEFDSFNNVGIINIKTNNATEGADTIIRVKSGSTISSFPWTYVNGSQPSASENGDGCSITWVLPAATSITMESTTYVGHIVAPNADIEIKGGNYNGCIIANSLVSQAEGHMWPYNGSTFQPSETGFKATKTVDGGTPSSAQVFSFTLEEWKNSAWNLLQTKSNNGSAIEFDKVSYAKGDEGDHYYRIKETVSGVDGYAIDTTSYIVKVTVTSSTSNGTTVQSTKTEYFVGDAVSAATSANAVTAITFNNKKEAGELSVNKVLTGSTSASVFYFTVTGPNGAVANPAGGTVFSVAANGAATVISDLPYGTYTVAETDANGIALTQGNPYSITYSSASVQLNAANAKAAVTITNAVGSLKVKKVLDKGADSVFYFTVKDSAGKLVKTTAGSSVWTVNANGETVISDLPFGNYTITEVKDSAGNAIDDKFGYLVTYSNSNQIAAVTQAAPAAVFTITNKEKPKGEISIVKEDYTDCYFLAGATFRLFKADGTPVYVTGGNGEYVYSETSSSAFLDMVTVEGGLLHVKDLPWGSYYFKETEPPAGYLYNSNIMLYFTIDGNGVRDTTTNLAGTLIKSNNVDSYHVKYYVMNERKPFRLKITKTYTNPAGQAASLEGVEFTLYKYNETTKQYEYYDKGVTLPDGTLTFLNLPWGSYKYVETGIPAGYAKTATSEGTFVINAESEIYNCGDPCGMPIYEVKVENKPISGGVELYKQSDKSKALPGAEFQLWKNGANGQSDATLVYATDNGSGNYIYSVISTGATSTFVTNNAGKILITNLPAGTYFFKEIKAPSGYVATTGAVGGFTIDVENETEKTTVVNTTFEAGVKFTKVDAEDHSITLGGTKFALWYKAVGDGGYKKLYDVTADGSGVVQVNGLALGSYYFVEIEAKTGYELDNTKRYFTLEDGNAGQIISLNESGLVENTRERGKVSLLKTDAAGTALSDVTFELWSDSDEFSGAVHDGYRKVGTYKTTSGAISVDDLPWGHYYFVETKTIDGYLLDATKHYFEINASNLDIRFEGSTKIVNQPVKGYVELIKQDAQDSSVTLNGVTFELYRVLNKGTASESASLVGTYATVNGKLAKDAIGALEYGDYYFIETRTIDGYLADTTTKYEFKISEQGALVTLTAKNERKLGEVTLEKWNAAKTKALDGAVFELYSTNPNSVWEAIQSAFGKDYFKYGEYTTAGGKISVKDLPWGDYYFVEKTAPTGYVLSDTKYPFTIDQAHLVVSLTGDAAAVNEEQLGALKLVKTGKDGAALAGAEFALYKDGERYPNAQTTYTTDDKGEIIVTQLPFGTYYFVEIKAPEGYETKTGDAAKTASVVINETNTGAEITAAKTISFSNDRIFGSLELKKVDAAGTALTGATFKLYSVLDNKETEVKTNGSEGLYVYDENGSKQTLSTTSAGKLSVTGLPYGTYRVYEETAPDGYNKKESPYEFNIGTQNAVITYNFENTKIQAGVRFLKVDANHAILAGAVFRLYKAGTNEDLGTVTADKDGVVEKLGLGAGSYYFVEETAPTGYQSNTKHYEFTISAADNGKIVGLDNEDAVVKSTDAVVNQPKKGEARLVKVIKGTNTGLAGAKFDLYAQGNNTPIMTDLVSDSDGYVTVTDLAWGSYYFKETKAPAGYAFNADTKYAFTVKAENVSSLIVLSEKAENELILGKAKLVKYDNDTKAVLAGALFDLYNADTQQPVAGYEAGIRSDANGVIETNKDLPAGSYYFKERTAPTGYVLDETKYAFVIDQSNMNTVVTAGEGKAYNTPVKGKAELFKYVLGVDGITKTGLAGAEFTLYVKDKALGFIPYTAKVDTYTTDANGIITATDLPWGEYYFKETKAPAGYELDGTQIPFTISATQLDYTGAARLSLSNEDYKGSIKLIKTDAGSGKALAGAVFKLYQVSRGTTVEIKNPTVADGSYTTDGKGQIIVTGLDWADYYFVEQSAPEGYALPVNTRTDTVSITKDNVEASVKTPLTIEAENEMVYGNVELTKVDDKTPATALSGAQFALYTAAGARVYVTGGNGNYTYSTSATDVTMETPTSGRLVVKRLPYGDYYFTETKAPAGYLINTGNITFKIEQNQTADAEAAVKVSCQNSQISAGVSFKKADTVASKPLAGVVFTLYKAGAAADGSDLQMSSYTSDANGIVSVTGLGTGSYYFVETSAPNDAYRLTDTHYTFAITESDNGKTVGLTNSGLTDNTVINYPKYGKVKLTKYYTVNGAVSGKLEGVTFNLYKGHIDAPATDPMKAGEYVGTYTTSSAGEISVENLEWGDYYFVETGAPAGYTIEKNSGGFNRPYNFTIDSVNVTTVQLVEVKNERETGSVEIEKISAADNSPLNGVVFELYKDYGTDSRQLIATLTTANGGTASKDGLAWGDYTLVEKSTLDGYILNTTPYSFTIDGSSLHKSFTGNHAIKNEKLQGYVELEKKNETTKAAMADVSFKLYKGESPNGIHLKTVTTDANGRIEKAIVGALDAGKYYFEEVTPVGYETYTGNLAFEIKTNGQTVSFTGSNAIINTPKDGSVKLKKTDENGAALKGAEFTLYANTPSSFSETIKSLFGAGYEYGKYYTNENGELSVSGLPWDSYYFVETKAPQGYSIINPDAIYEFTIGAGNAAQTIELGTVKNAQQPGSIKLTKTDKESGGLLAGAEFKLYFVSDGGDQDVSALYGAVNGVFTTASDGTITVSNVAWGSYYFLETKAPDGYEAISGTNIVKSAVVTIDANNADAVTNVMQQQSVAVANQKGYGYVSLLKTFDGTQPADLSGIGFTLVNKDTNIEVGSYKTDASGKISADIIGKLPYGDYYFMETSVPVGASYAVSDYKLEFSITESCAIADAVQYTFVNSEIKASAKFSKADAATTEIIPGIVFDVYNAAAGSKIGTAISNAQGIVAIEHLPMGSYYFLENEASAKAAGYVPDTTKYYFDITEADRQTVNADGTKTEKFVDVYTKDAAGNQTTVTTVTNTKENGSIELVKFGKGSGGTPIRLSLTDAEFELYKDGALYKSAQELKALYSGGTLVVTGLPWGTYYFLETKAPAGYQLPAGNAAKTNAVTIDSTTVTGSATTPLTCQMTDDTNKLYISKMEIGGAKELAGAAMELYLADAAGNRTGTAVASWTSGTTAKLFEIGNGLTDGQGLVAGQSYVLHEDTAPLGYALTTDIVFTVNADGSITTTGRTIGSGNGMTLILEDAVIDVSISKKELGTSTELPGASLVIKHGSDVVEEWQTSGQPHKITAPLKVGETYTLEETKAPNGYYTAQPITFMIRDNGTLQITSDASATAELNGTADELTMYDRPIRVEISKKRLTGGTDDYVEGAELTLYGQDAAGAYTEQVYTWTSPAGGAVLIPFGKLVVGKNYKIVETGVPAGYVKAADVIFTVKDYNQFARTDADGTVTQSETIYDGMTKVVISKQSISGTKELPGAALQVVDGSGKVLASWTSGDKPVLLSALASEAALSATEKAAYADYTVIYGVALEAGKTYTLVETASPDGYAIAQSVEFTVDEKGATSPSPVVMKDKPLEILLSKKDLKTDTNLEGAVLQLLDKSGTVLHEWTSSEKPVLFTQRTVDASEASQYAEVVKLILMETKDETAPYTYTLHEVSAPTGYTVAADLKFTVKGSDVQKENGDIREESLKNARGGEVSLKGTKTWVIPKDVNGNAIPGYTYPDVTIELYRDSAAKGVMDTKPYDSIVLKNGAENYEFGPLEQYKYKAAGGVDYEYTYTVKEALSEEAKEQFTSEEIKDASGNVTGFTNRLKQEKTELSGEKIWLLFKDASGNIDRTKDYADVTIYLLRDGVRVDADGDGKVDSVTIKNGAIGTGGKEAFAFKNLDKYDLKTGKEYAYTVEEVGDNTYESNITVNEHISKVTNVPFHDPFRISGKKLWIDPVGTTRPDVTIELYRDGKLFKTTKLKADNTFDFGGLYEYNLGWGNKYGVDPDDDISTADGHKYIYTLKETGATGYSFEVDFNGEIRTLTSGERISDASITNTITQEYIQIGGRKYWDDAGDASRRPTVTINLYATDSAGRSHALVDTYYLSNTSTTYTFGTEGRVKLPKYDTNGQIITYTVEEGVLSGYVSSQSGTNFTNTPSKVRISKLDATTSAELPGAVLALYRVSTGGEVDRWTSTTSTHYVEGLVLGESYRLVEISAPAGYTVASPVTFTVRTDGVEQTVTMRDDRIVGSVTLTKRDASTRAALSGAVFNLYTSAGTLVRATGSTGAYVYSASTAGTTSLAVSSAGTLSVTGLPYGTYYFREITAPSGYALSSATEAFTIAESGASAAVTFLNTRSTGAVRLTKANAGATSALAGAVFELYSRTPQTVGQAAASTIYGNAYYRYGTYTTNSAGEIYVGSLPWDDYYFIEVEAPAGYAINRDTNGDPLVYTFTVDSTSAAAVSVSLGTVTNSPGDDGGEEGGVLSGVLGVRSAPTSGVLGERVGPVTGDAANIALWILLLVASVAVIIAIFVQNKSRKTPRDHSRRS